MVPEHLQLLGVLLPVLLPLVLLASCPCAPPPPSPVIPSPASPPEVTLPCQHLLFKPLLFLVSWNKEVHRNESGEEKAGVEGAGEVVEGRGVSIRSMCDLPDLFRPTSRGRGHPPHHSTFYNFTGI